MKKILILLLISVLISPSVLSIGENEYLFDGESTNRVFLVSINAREEGENVYTIYEITKNNGIDLTGQNRKELLVIGPSNFIAEDEEIKNSFLTYYTYIYFNDNLESISQDQQNAGNYIRINSNTFEQGILNILKSAPELCKEIPKFEIAKICIKPSKDVEIMTILDKDIPDWKVADNVFNSLRGEISLITGPKKFALFETAKRIHQLQMTTENFLGKVDTIDKYPTFNSQVLDNFVGSNSNEEFVKLSDRISKLKSDEQAKNEEINSLLKNITFDVKEIAKLNGNYSVLNSRKNEIYNKLEDVDLDDKYYTSDIMLLKDNMGVANQLKNETLHTLDKTKDNHNKKKVVFRAFNRFVGFFKYLFI